MKIKHLLFSLLLAAPTLAQAQEKLIIVNQGLWQNDNARLSYFVDNKVVSNNWFSEVNGQALGDTPNDIIQVDNNLIAITLTNSNILQFINTEGRAVKEIEIPAPQRMCFDGKYIYVTSYAHECRVGGATKTFTHGFVAKVDIASYTITAAVEVGYEPDGIAAYKGKLYVANSGGYAWQESHDYEKTVSIVDAATMTELRKVDTGAMNLYGKVSQMGRYLCINAAGDYGSNPAATVIFDCEAAEQGDYDGCFVKLGFASTYNTAAGNVFYAIGSEYSYDLGGYKYDYKVIDPAKVLVSAGAEGADGTWPGDLLAGLKKLKMPYGIYSNPYTGYVYATDAVDNLVSGKLYRWTPEGAQADGPWTLYVNPGSFLALPPNGEFSGLDGIEVQPVRADGRFYNLQGIEVRNPVPGTLYIRDGKKIIF